MKKLITSLFLMMALSFSALGQGNWLTATTNLLGQTWDGTNVNIGSSSNNTWYIDKIQFIDYASAGNPPFTNFNVWNVRDNGTNSAYWWVAARTNVTTYYSNVVDTYISFMTQMTNYTTNATMFRLESIQAANFDERPIMWSGTPSKGAAGPSITTYEDLGLLTTRGLQLDTAQSISSNITINVWYKKLNTF